MNYCRGIRGATSVEGNTKEEIISATRELLEQIIKRNNIVAEDVASALFTLTQDLDAEFPAVAAREIGWTEQALMCSRELPVPGSLNKCIRVLIHINTSLSQAEMQHVYLHRATSLRPTYSREI